ncbi:MAG: antibiotic biosynthesis monooxygenase [Gammaproteobacteria bacterium]|nr:antibiotic biosynthesis monooxygenase [Gammaproteobacteria bacterium]|tara:strand:+ start:159 stop:458 length:300 start_codon:yes stop_codon:yes gene_type:complete
MVYNNVLLRVKDIKNISLVRELLKEQAKRSSEEPGCIRFEVYHSSSDVQQFILVEQWANDGDLERHKNAKAFTELYLPKVIPLVDRSPHLSELLWPDLN